MSRPLISSVLKSSSTAPAPFKQPAALVGVFEHRLSAESSSPMVSLAMTLPAGAKYSCTEEDCGQIAAAYKHAILQGTKTESRISLARKADLRPSPLTATLSPDLLTLQSSFHVNYLPEILNTFRGLLDGPELKDFDLENTIKPAVLLDGQLAESDSRLILLQAARRAAFQSNNLYFSSSEALNNSITTEKLKSFHSQTMQRAAEQKQQYSLLLSVNSTSLLDLKEFGKVVSSCGVPILSGYSSVSQAACSHVPEAHGTNLEKNCSKWNEFMLAFPVPEGGFNQKNCGVSSVLESLLKRAFPTTEASITSDTCLLTIYFKFATHLPSEEIKSQMQKIVSELNKFPENINKDDVGWAKERSKFNQALAIDSRDNRLLSYAHQFAFSGSLPGLKEPNTDQVMELLKQIVAKKPFLIGRGNYKKLLNYTELF